MSLPVKRDPQGRIVQGALNPSGRPKVDTELARAARELSPLALQVWEKTMKDYLDGNGSAADAIRAASDSMSRGFGKPPEYVLTAELEAPTGGRLDPSKLTKDELDLMIDLTRRAACRARGEEVSERLHIPDGLISDGATLSDRVARSRRILGVLERAGALTVSFTEGNDADQDEEEA